MLFLLTLKMQQGSQMKAGAAVFTDSVWFQKYNHIVYKEVETLSMLFLLTLKVRPGSQDKAEAAAFTDRLYMVSKQDLIFNKEVKTLYMFLV